MLTSLSLIFLVGLAMGAICSHLKLPRIIGMLVTGIVLGPYVLDFLDPSILSISADLRKIALIIILLKAGLSLDLGDLKKVGRPAILLSFLPASFEILGYVLLAPAWHHAYGSSCYGDCHGRCLTCRSRTSNGLSDGDPIRNEEIHSADDPCRSFLR